MDAEKAFALRKSTHKLAFMVPWFEEHYREPKTDKKLPELFELFRDEKTHDIRPATVGPMMGNIKRFANAYAERFPHDITTSMVLEHLRTLRGKRKVQGKNTMAPPASKKTWNNNRADIHVNLNRGPDFRYSGEWWRGVRRRR